MTHDDLADSLLALVSKKEDVVLLELYRLTKFIRKIYVST